jgi:hypothetical protein
LDSKADLNAALNRVNSWLDLSRFAVLAGPRFAIHRDFPAVTAIVVVNDKVCLAVV